MNKMYKIEALPPRLVIGRQTETGVEMVQFDCAAWLSVWPEMEISVWPVRPGDIAAYPAVIERAGNIITWTITDVDTAVDGEGSVEVMGIADGKRKLSARAVTHILASGLGNTQDPPEGAKPWVDEVLDAAKRAENAADITAHPPIIGANGNWWLWDAAAGAYVDSGKPSQGAGGSSSDIAIDTTLSVPGAAADAAVVGGKIEELSEEISEKQPKGDYALKSEIPTVPAPYILPTASADVKGGVKVGEGLQMDGDVLGVVPEGEYELIETITLTEDGLITRTAEPDGTPYRFNAVYMEIISALENFNGFNVYFEFANGSSHPLWVEKYTGNTLLNNKYAYLEVAKQYGLYHARYRPHTTNNYITSLQESVIAKAGGGIKAIKVANIASAGTTFDIWGVRA